jgi:hypothetical protein
MNLRRRMPLSHSWRSIAVIFLVLLAGFVTLLPGAVTAARPTQPPRMAEFLWGLAGQESGWDYTVRNSASGAYGKYQIMPSNWPSWSDHYLGDGWADQSPRNQELVVRGKIADLFRWLGSWRRVAYWWLTGDTETAERRWSSMARGYVDNVMALARRAPPGGDPIPPDTAGDGPPAERGDWRLVVDGATLFDRLTGNRRHVAQVRDGQVVFVQGSAWDGAGVLWMRVSTSGDDVGWLSIRRTVPARKPANADRWPRGDGSHHPDPDDRRRDRARPRPR